MTRAQCGAFEPWARTIALAGPAGTRRTSALGDRAVVPVVGERTMASWQTSRGASPARVIPWSPKGSFGQRRRKNESSRGEPGRRDGRIWAIAAIVLSPSSPDVPVLLVLFEQVVPVRTQRLEPHLLDKPARNLLKRDPPGGQPLSPWKWHVQVRPHAPPRLGNVPMPTCRRLLRVLLFHGVEVSCSSNPVAPGPRLHDDIQMRCIEKKSTVFQGNVSPARQGKRADGVKRMLFGIVERCRTDACGGALEGFYKVAGRFVWISEAGRLAQRASGMSIATFTTSG